MSNGGSLQRDEADVLVPCASSAPAKDTEAAWSRFTGDCSDSHEAPSESGYFSNRKASENREKKRVLFCVHRFILKSVLLSVAGFL